MADLNSSPSQWAARLLSILRIVAALLLMQHGAQKFFGYPPPAPSPCPPPVVEQNAQQPAAPQPKGMPPLILVVAILELVGGLILLLGLFSRPIAFVLSGLMAVAYFMAHAPGGFWPVTNGGELAVLYCFVFLYLAAAGGGPWSLDSLLRRSGGPHRYVRK